MRLQRLTALFIASVASVAQAADPSSSSPTWEQFAKLICRADHMTECKPDGCNANTPTAVVIVDFAAGTVRPLAIKEPYQIMFRNYRRNLPGRYGHAWATRILDSTGEVWTFDDPKAGIGDVPTIQAISARTGFGSSLTYWSTCTPA